MVNCYNITQVPCIHKGRSPHWLSQQWPCSVVQVDYMSSLLLNSTLLLLLGYMDMKKLMELEKLKIWSSKDSFVISQLLFFQLCLQPQWYIYWYVCMILQLLVVGVLVDEDVVCCQAISSMLLSIFITSISCWYFPITLRFFHPQC